DIDSDGIVHCSARDAGSGIKQGVTIQRSAGLNPEEIELMEKEAAQFAKEDAELRESVSARIHAESLVAEAERTIQRYGDRVETGFVEKVRRAMDGVKEALATGDFRAISAVSAGLDVSLLDLGRAIHVGSRQS